MQFDELWDDPQDISGSSGRNYYKRATITWSIPRLWLSSEREFRVPPSWSGRGGIYVFIRSHWKQKEPLRIAYVGKALNFNKRLTNTHNHFDIVERPGNTTVSCGRTAFSGKAHPGHYIEIEDIVKFCIHNWLENKQGFESLPGFRTAQPRPMTPWLIINKGYRLGGLMPRRIVYPAFGVEF